MANSRGSAQGAFSLEPRHAQRLRQAIPDLDDWPRSWHVEPANILVGQQIVQELAPFLLRLLDQRLAKATLRRHRDNLWALGGELIRCRYDDDELAEKHVKDPLQQRIEGDGGPLAMFRSEYSTPIDDERIVVRLADAEFDHRHGACVRLA